MFEFDPQARHVILRTRDDCLVWWHFQTLFDSSSYEETVYFLPFAFRYLFQRYENFDEVIPTLIRWIALNTPRLDADKLLEPVRQNLLISLGEWTGDFHIGEFAFTHLRGVSAIPKNARAVTTCLLELIRNERQGDLVTQFLRSLSYRSSAPFQLAWFLELSLVLLKQNCFSSSRHPVSLPAEVENLLVDPHLRRHAALVVLNKLAPLPEQALYWDHLFSALGIA